jgi:preprotein translocase subunit YajC
MNIFLLQLPQAQQGTQGMLMQLLPFVLIIVVFYFFMIRPQMKRQKELRKFRESLKKGDKVVTTGGIYGVVNDIKDQYVIVEVSEGVKIKIDKAAVIMDMTDASQR